MGGHAKKLQNAEQVPRLLKALSNQDRLMILCNLTEGEKNVSELEKILNIRQPTLSQQLARLRADNLVATRRAGKAIYYTLASGEAERIIELLYVLFRGAEAADTRDSLSTVAPNQARRPKNPN